MPNLESIMAELKKKGTEQTRKTYARHGMASERVLGVLNADLKLIAKTIKGQQALAYELYDTGVMEAMYLAAMVADGAKMTRQQLQAWGKASVGLRLISEHAVPWVTVENPAGRELALKWIASKEPDLAACGWRAYSGLLMTKPDEELDLAEVGSLIDKAAQGVHKGAERVQYTMNGFIMAAGSYVKPMFEHAYRVAKEIGTVSIDMGDTACKIPVAAAAIEKVKASGQLGKKRKTMRC